MTTPTISISGDVPLAQLGGVGDVPDLATDIARLDIGAYSSLKVGIALTNSAQICALTISWASTLANLKALVFDRVDQYPIFSPSTTSLYNPGTPNISFPQEFVLPRVRRYVQVGFTEGNVTGIVFIYGSQDQPSQPLVIPSQAGGLLLDSVTNVPAGPSINSLGRIGGWSGPITIAIDGPGEVLGVYVRLIEHATGFIVDIPLQYANSASGQAFASFNIIPGAWELYLVSPAGVAAINGVAAYVVAAPSSN